MQFVGFTATPNAEALHLFGSRASGGALRPFHCYPISRATADSRIKNVLDNYKCLRFDVETTIPNDVLDALRDEHALRDVLDHASDDVTVLKAKAALMMQDFLDTKEAYKFAKVRRVRRVWRCWCCHAALSHRSVQCMIVARSRRDVLRYYQLVSVFVANRCVRSVHHAAAGVIAFKLVPSCPHSLFFVFRQLKWSIYAAFSGSLTVEDSSGTTVTEDTLNGSQLNLTTSDIVIVCDKLDTGYNDPKLSCMYIDRYLRSSSQTVQLTSRLNRLHKGELVDAVHLHAIASFSLANHQLRQAARSHRRLLEPRRADPPQLRHLLGRNASAERRWRRGCGCGVGGRDYRPHDLM